jgi:hypothetical protein
MCACNCATVNPVNKFQCRAGGERFEANQRRSAAGMDSRHRVSSRAQSLRGLHLRHTELDGDFVDPLPPVSIRRRSFGRPAAGNDDGFAERLQIFLLADRMHRPQLCQQFVDQRTQPRPRRAVRE